MQSTQRWMDEPQEVSRGHSTGERKKNIRKGRTVTNFSDERRSGNAKKAENCASRLFMRGQAGSGKHHESAEYCPHRKRRRRKSANVARMYPHQSEHGRGVQTGSQKRRCVRHRRNDSPSDVWTPERALSRTYPKPLRWKLQAPSSKESRNPQSGRRKAQAGNPHGHRPYDTASHLPSADANIREAILRRQLWIPQREKRPSGNRTGEDILRTGIQSISGYRPGQIL